MVYPSYIVREQYKYWSYAYI